MIYFLLIVFAIASRFIPHLSNAAAITALAIFAGSHLPKKQAIALPLVARLITDSIIGFFAWPQMLAVYGAHVVGVLFGLWIKDSKGLARWEKIVGSGFGAALVFFTITNFAFLYPEPQYMHNLSGVILSYTNGLPFLRGTLLGDIGYVTALFGAYEFATFLVKKKQQSKLAPSHA